MVFQRIVQIFLVLLVVLTVLIHAELIIEDQYENPQPRQFSQSHGAPHAIVIKNNVDKEMLKHKRRPGQVGESGLVEVASGKLELGKLGEDFDTESVLTRVLGKLQSSHQTKFGQPQLRQQQSATDQLVRNQLTKEQVVRKQLFQKQGVPQAIVIKNDVDKEMPKRKKRPGQVGQSGLVEVASGKLDLGSLGEGFDPESVLTRVLGKLQSSHQTKFGQPQLRQQQSATDQLVRNQLTKEQVVRKQLFQKQGVPQAIVIKNDVDKEMPKRKKRPGQVGQSGLVEVASGKLDLGSLGEGFDSESVLTQVLGKLQLSHQAKFAQQQLIKDQLIRNQLAKEELLRKQSSQNQGLLQRISFTNDVDIEKPKRKKRPGQQGLSGLVEVTSGKLELGNLGEGIDQGALLDQVLGKLQATQKKKLGPPLLGQEVKPIVQPIIDQQQEILTELQTDNNKKPHGSKNKKKNKNKNKNPSDNDLQRVITTKIPQLGRVSGHISLSKWAGKRIMQFFDVPYGQPPVGELRFKPSLPVEPWSGVIKANKPHSGCPSLQNMNLLLTSSDNNHDLDNCLRLSIYTKNLKSSAAVMVYIHGDFLYDGNALEAAPGYLLEEDVVLVSVRYRLGPFGFLSTMSNEIPGNAAVHDVILALQWIQKHIAHFGGDPKRVTLFGQVGGAAMINILTMSPVVPENLFHRVILQSGSALSPAFITEDPMPAARGIAKKAGCKDLQNIANLNKCLLQLNNTELLKAFNEHGNTKEMKGLGSYAGAQFVVGGPSGVLPEEPGKLMANENLKAYPTMGGSVKHAGTFILRDIFIDNFNESIADKVFNGNGYIDYFIKQTNGADPTDAWKKYATEEIFSAADIKKGTFHRMLPGLIDMCSTIGFKNPLLLALQANAKKLPKATYLYSFDYAGEINRYEAPEDDALHMPFDLGVSLTDENLYLFPWPQSNLIGSNRDLKIAKRMVALWASFASTGVPKAPGLPAWPAMSDDTGPYMKLGTTVSIADNYLDEYTVAVKEAQLGYSLVNEDYFKSLNINVVEDVQLAYDKDSIVKVEANRSYLS